LGTPVLAIGHRAKLIAPQYVKPFVERGQSDRIDAEVISEAAAQPTMRFVPVKPAAQQTSASVLKVSADPHLGQRSSRMAATSAGEAICG
jgi:transposase